MESEKQQDAINQQLIDNLIDYGLRMAIRLFKGEHIEIIMREISGGIKTLKVLS
jgi:hypothetical protein